MIYIKYSELKKFTKKVLINIKVNNSSAKAVSDGLCETSLRGVDSHGIRLFYHYVQSAIYGRKNKNPKFKIKKKFPAIATLDADNAFGHAAGDRAIDICIKMAKKYGIGIVVVINSSHPGAMASMTLKAARKNYICWGFTHADSLLLSYNGKRPYFGTNPICVSVPRKGEEPYCLDMATSKISWNKLLNLREKNKKLMDDLASNSKGNVTNNPKLASALMPIGSYKGFGLASLVEILCSIYSGMDFGRNIKSMYKTPLNVKRKLGQFYMTMKIDGTLNSNTFLKRMQVFSKTVRREPAKKNKKVVLPNDPEIFISKRRMKTGIPLDKNTYNQFLKLSKRFDVKLVTIK